MFNFQPDIEKESIPFFDDVTKSDGWEGHTTSKSIERLQREIQENMTRIGCLVTGIIGGKFGDRHGFQIHFAMRSQEGRMIASRLDIACLPLNPKKRTRARGYNRGTSDWRIEATKKMALYMTNEAVKGMRFLSVLSPEFVPFMSQMLDQGGKTLGKSWIDSGRFSALLPAPESFDPNEVIDAE